MGTRVCRGTQEYILADQGLSLGTRVCRSFPIGSPVHKLTCARVTSLHDMRTAARARMARDIETCKERDRVSERKRQRERKSHHGFDVRHGERYGSSRTSSTYVTLLDLGTNILRELTVMGTKKRRARFDCPD